MRITSLLIPASHSFKITRLHFVYLVLSCIDQCLWLKRIRDVSACVVVDDRRRACEGMREWEGSLENDREGVKERENETDEIFTKRQLYC